PKYSRSVTPGMESVSFLAGNLIMRIRCLETTRSKATQYVVAITAGLLLAISASQAHAGACDKSTAEALKACSLSAGGDYNNAVGVCDNIRAQADRQACISQAANDQTAALKLCDKQQTARQKVCN